MTTPQQQPQQPGFTPPPPSGQPVIPQSAPQQPAPMAPPAPAPAPQSAPQPMAQQPAPQQPVQQPVVQGNQPIRHHVHHSYIWLGTIQSAFAVLFVMIISGFSSVISVLAEGEALMRNDVTLFMLIIGGCFVAFLLIVGLIALIHWWSYKHLYYELDPEEFSLYSGIFNKKRMHVPYQRIQSVDQHASLLQRIFGVCTVQIDTAGGAANSAARVPYVQKTQAEELRRELFARKQYMIAVQNGVAPGTAATAAAAAAAGTTSSGAGNVLDAPAEIWNDVRGIFAGGAIDTGRVTYEYGLSNKELVFTGLSNNTAFLVVVLGILGAVTQVVSEVAPLVMGAADPVVGHVSAVSVQLFSGNVWAFGVVAFLGAAVILWLFSAVGACISYGGFRACRRDNRIEVEQGLLQHRFQGVDVDRVQSVVVKQSFIRRLMGYCELSLGKIDAAADSSNDQQQKSLSQQGIVIHPFVKMDRVPEILAGIIPEFADVPSENTPVAPVALRRAIIRRSIIQGSGFWLAILIVCAQVSLNLLAMDEPDNEAILSLVNTGALIGYALCVALFALDVIGAVLWFRGSGFAYNKRFMQVSNGGFARETVSFPRRKIQFGFTKSNPFQRRAHTVTVHARTAAGVGGTTIRLIDAQDEDAAAWLAWLEPVRESKGK